MTAPGALVALPDSDTSGVVRRACFFHNLYVIIAFMKEGAPSLLPLLRSRSQGDILAWIMLHPDEGHSLKEIADAVGVSSPTVMREVDRLVDAGFVSEVVQGNRRVIRPVTDSVVFRPLSELMAVTFGPLTLLRDALCNLPGIEHAFIYGSWAARYRQEPGLVPGDIDVMVIGKVDREALDRAMVAAERQLRREVNVRVVTPERWEADNGSFKNTVLQRPTVPLIEARSE
jgi:DNA-binding transcriptional ArsR family regulator